MGRKLLKVLLWGLSSLVALVLLLVILVYIPPVQDFIKNKAVRYVSGKFGVTLSVDRLRLHFPLKLTLGPTTVLTPRGDTLLHFSHLEADAALWPLFRKEVVLRSFDFSDASLHYADTLNGMALNARLKEFALKADRLDLKHQTADLPDMELTDGNIRLTMGESRPDTAQKKPVRWKADLGRLRLDNIAFTMETHPRTADLSVVLDAGTLSGAALDMAARTVRAESLELERGAYRYLTDTAAVRNKAPASAADSPAADSLPWTVRVDRVALTDNALLYGTFGSDPRPGFDPSHIGITALDLTVDSVYSRGSDLKVFIRDLSLDERSGLKIESLTGRFSMDSVRYRLEGFELRTPHSRLTAQADVGTAIGKAPDTAPVELRAQGTLGSRDFFLAYPPKNPSVRRTLEGKSLNVDVRLDGTLGDLKLEKTDIVLPGSLSLRAEGRLRSVNDPKRMSGDLNLNGDFTRIGFLTALLDTGLQRRLTLPPMRLRGRVRVDRGTYVPALALSVGEGRLSVNGSFNPRSQAYKGTVQCDSFPLGRFLPADSLGAVSFRLTAEGKGFDPYRSDTRAELDLNLGHLEYHRRVYRDMALQARYAQNALSGRLTSGNDALDLNLALNARLTKAKQQAHVRGVVRNLDLKALGLAREELGGSVRLDLTASATDTRAYAVKASLDSLRVYDKKSRMSIRPIALAADASPEQVSVTMNTGDLHLDFVSSASLDSLTAGFRRTAALVKAQVEKGAVDMEPVNAALPPFKLNLTAGRSNIINNYLSAGGKSIDGLSLTAASVPGRPFNFRARVYRVATKGIVLDTLVVGASRQDRQLNYFVRLSNAPGNINNMALITLYGNAVDNRLAANLYQRNREKRIGFRFGLEATLADSAVNLRLTPGNPVFGFESWQVNPNNYVIYHFDKRMDADLELTNGEQYVRIESARRSDMPPGSIRLDMAGIDIGNTLSLFPVAPPIQGVLSTDLTVGLHGKGVSADGTVNVRDLTYDRHRLATVDLNVLYKLDEAADQQVGLKLTLDRQEAMTVEGSYHPGDRPALDIDADIPGLPLALVNPFIPDSLARFSGDLKGRLKVTGVPSRPGLDGELRFVSTRIAVPMIGTTFALSENPVAVTRNDIVFDDFALIAPNNDRLVVNGDVDVLDFADMTADLRVEASDFELIDVEHERNSVVFGKAYADIDASVTGPLDRLDIEGDISLLRNTDVTYVLQASPLSVRNRQQNVVTFVSFRELAVRAEEPVRALRLGGVNVLLNLEIDPDVKLAVWLSDDGQNRITLQGGGNLTYSLNRLGDSRFSGKYVLSGGDVRYNPPVIAQKDFGITSGSYVEWTGEIADPTLSIQAVEKVRTSVSTDDSGSRSVGFDIIVNISNTLKNLAITFDLSAPEDLTIQNQLSSMTAEQRSNQAMGLLIYNTYNGPGTTGKVNVGNPLNSFITNELNQWAQDNLKGVDLSFGIDSYDEEGDGREAHTDYSYKLTKRLFDNRVRAVIGGKISTGADPADNLRDNLVDDVALEYMLNDRDNMYLKVFRQTDYESILEGEVTRTGVGFVVQKKMQKITDLFKSTPAAKARKAERRAQRKARRAEDASGTEPAAQDGSAPETAPSADEAARPKGQSTRTFRPAQQSGLPAADPENKPTRTRSDNHVPHE